MFIWIVLYCYSYSYIRVKIPLYLAGVGFVQSVTDYGKGSNNNIAI